MGLPGRSGEKRQIFFKYHPHYLAVKKNGSTFPADSPFVLPKSFRKILNPPYTFGYFLISVFFIPDAKA